MNDLICSITTINSTFEITDSASSFADVDIPESQTLLLVTLDMEAGSDNKEPTDVKTTADSPDNDDNDDKKPTTEEEVSEEEGDEAKGDGSPGKRRKPAKRVTTAAKDSDVEKTKESDGSQSNSSTPPKKRGRKMPSIKAAEAAKPLKVARKAKSAEAAKEKQSTDNGNAPENKQSVDVDIPMVEDPNLPNGWKRKVVQRQTGKTAGHFDVYIYSPEGRKFRSRYELANHLADTNSKLDIDSFDFTIRGRSNTPRSKPKPTVTRKNLTKPASLNTEKVSKSKRGRSNRLVVKLKFKGANKGASSPTKAKPTPRTSSPRQTARSRKSTSTTDKGTRKKP